MGETVGSVTKNWYPNNNYTVDQLIEGRNYYWRITAFDGLDGSGTAIWTTGAMGPVRVNLKQAATVKGMVVAPVSASTVSVSWAPAVKATRYGIRLYTTPNSSALSTPAKSLLVNGATYCPPEGQEQVPTSVALTPGDVPGVTDSNRLFFINGVSYRCDGPALQTPYPNVAAGAFPYPQPATAHQFDATVMSFNALGQAVADTENAGSWSARRPVLAAQIRNADIVGIQELQFAPVDGTSYVFDLAQAAGLTVAQRGSSAAPQPCYAGVAGYGVSEDILFNANKFSLSRCGGTSIDTVNDRHLIWAVLKDKASGQEVLVLNTHLVVGDDQAPARTAEAQAIVSELANYRSDPAVAKGLPVILTGDFNSWETETTDAPATVVQQRGGLIGADWVAKQRTNITYPSNHTWSAADLQARQYGERLDHIMTDENVVVRSFSVDVPSPLNHSTAASDHFSLTAAISVYQPATESAVCPAWVTITGDPWPGRTISAHAVSSAHETCPGSVEFQWYRAGKAVLGAKTGSYLVTGLDVGRSLTVRVNTVTSPAVTAQFADVPPTHLFFGSIGWLANTGITAGTGDGSTYSPSNPVNRGSMAQFLYRLAGEPKYTAPDISPFADLQKGDTFYKAICWLADQGITQGSLGADGKLYYLPKNAVNRGSMAAFLRRMAGNPPWKAPASSPFVDVPTNHLFYGSITWLADRGITQGVTQNGLLLYQPGNVVNRGSMAAFLKRLSDTGLVS